MSEHDKRTTDGAATARRLGESGELVSRYQAAVGEHVGRMATVNADLRRELAGARAETHELRTILAATRDRLDNTIVDLSEAHDALDACARAVGRLRALLVEIKRLVDAASEATMTRSTLDLAWRVGRIAERHMPVTMEEADTPGQGAGGSDHGH